MNQIIANNFEKLIAHFGLELREAGKYYIGKCPIHEGDNPTALNYYHTMGRSAIGNWVCNTNQCHKKYGQHSLGFIQGLLSTREQREFTKQETINWAEKFFDSKYEHTNIGMSHFINRIYGEDETKYNLELDPKQYRQSGLEIPSPYFLERGYKASTLEHFEIGYCSNNNKPMYGRSIVPLYKRDGTKIIGISGRISWGKCNVCGNYHDPKLVCPPKKAKYQYSKWKHNKGFPAQELYNFHLAKEFIQKSGLAIITEGQPNVWRLHEAGFPMSVGSFGSKFTSNQKKLLDLAGTQTILVVPDADQASKKLVSNIKDLCKHSHNIIVLEPKYEDDIGECNIDTVKKLILPFVEKYI